ncbi:MAG TPA: helicase-exonuclease AddAB subunit AddA [Jeotgalicoccus sp.]|nr:helicase-exonuclease AddAB subunit AddA [Jeotgalicoccus sp.]
MVKFTAAQQEAIKTKGSDVLVSAAAGSGKTAVLVERIKQNIIDGNYSIDEVFVSTFTNKSAKDMKDKIERALRETYNTTPDPRLNEEIIKLNDAHISTLHSFCLYLIQTHYNAVGLPPDMRTLGQVEAEIRLQNIISNVLEQFYVKADDDFLKLDQFVTSNKDNSELHKLVTQLYHVAIATKDPGGFLNNIIDQYISEDKLTAILNGYKAVIERKLKKLDQDLYTLRAEYDSAERDEELKEKPIDDAYEKLAVMHKYVLHALESFNNEGYFKLPPAKLVTGANAFIKSAAAYGNELNERFNKPANALYQELSNLKQYTPDDVKAELAPLNGMNNQLISIVSEVIEAYRKDKQSSNEMDFNDYEHYALGILTANESEIANRYKEQFKEIMIDEYQDVNRVQEAIIQLLKSGGEDDGNLFMVGDVKQSIYRFRQAAPDLFIDKSERFNEPDSGTLIQLNRNFRSRSEILDATNLIFENIMDKELGEIDYTDEEKLIKGIETAEPESTVEVLPVIYDKTLKSAQADELEIKQIVKLVQELYKKGAEYQDIVILNRNRFAPDVMRHEFQKADIPISIDVNKGYFETFEILTMRSILSLIDNPLQDDHLAGVMRLPMFGFSEEEISRIRIASEEKYLYEALTEYNDDEFILRKIEEFTGTFKELKLHAKYLSVPELISEIYFELNILEFFSGLPGGSARRANLNGLIDRALEFQSMNNTSLYQFISYIDFLISEGKDFGEEGSLENADDAVRVMTIHSSKGLEFKHVIYADLKQNYTLTKVTRVYVHPKLGIVFNNFNDELNYHYESIHGFTANDFLNIEQLSEELRLIYVALTRAEEKLYLPLMFKGEAEYKYDFSRKEKPSFETRAELRSAMDFLAPVLMQSDVPYIEVKEAELSAAAENERIEYTSLEDIDALNADIIPEVRERLFYTYPNTGDTEVTTKESVTSIKRRNETIPDGAEFINHTSEVNLREPNFLADSLEAPIFGTIMHEMMMHIMHQWQTLSLMDDNAKTAYIETLIDNYSENYELLSTVHIKKMKENAARFFNDSKMNELLNEQRGIYTELPFIMSQEAIGYAEHPEQIVQGIIDCLLEYDDHYTIIDYKTDRVAGTNLTGEQLADRYSTQMDIYTKSAQVSLGKPVTAVLYFFDYGAIPVE